MKLKKSQEKYEALLKATLQLVNSGGIQAASMAKVAKIANVSPATIYIYFENKQDLINELYLSVKESFCTYALSDINMEDSVEDNFKKIWFKMIEFKQRYLEKSCFLSQCDNTPMIDENTREKGLQHLKPLLDVWEKGIKDHIIKDISPYILYAYTVYPMAFLIKNEINKNIELDNKTLQDAYVSAWHSIKN